jgi:hypothetical protein
VEVNVRWNVDLAGYFGLSLLFVISCVVESLN